MREPWEMRVAPARYVKGRRARRTPALVLAGIALVGLLALAGAALAMAAQDGAAGGAGAAATNATKAADGTSTPKDEWALGSVPYLYQTDPAWASHPYAGGTVRENGCGPTCLAMAYVALTGSNEYDPAAMADFSEREGYVQDGMTAWALMTDGAGELGLDSEQLPATAQAVASALAAGKVVICSVVPGDFTTVGHFIVLAGLTDDGQVEVHDPNSAERSRAWDLDRVLGQCANLWALSA